MHIVSIRKIILVQNEWKNNYYGIEDYEDQDIEIWWFENLWFIIN